MITSYFVHSILFQFVTIQKSISTSFILREPSIACILSCRQFLCSNELDLSLIRSKFASVDELVDEQTERRQRWLQYLHEFVLPRVAPFASWVVTLPILKEENIIIIE